MLTPQLLIETVSNVAGSPIESLDTTFLELELDSTQLVEILIELEMKLDVDVLSDELNLDEFQTLQDMYDYVGRIVSG